MHHAQQLDAVRRIVQSTFEQHSGRQADEITEKILVRDGFYCGRCFNFSDYRAVWFVEEGQVKFYGPDGYFFCACAHGSAGSPEPLRRVA
jgi:hypothetical protein